MTASNLTPNDPWDELIKLIDDLLHALEDVTKDVEANGLCHPKYHSPFWPESARKARDLLIRIEEGYP